MCFKIQMKNLYLSYSGIFVINCNSITKSKYTVVTKYLKKPDGENNQTNGLHYICVVIQQGMSAAFSVQVQFFRLIVVVIMR